MKSIFKVTLALAFFACSIPVHAQTPTATKTTSAPKAGAKITKKSQLHDGCHSRAAQMSGKPCR
jgi:hypothetical protein